LATAAWAACSRQLTCWWAGRVALKAMLPNPGGPRAGGGPSPDGGRGARRWAKVRHPRPPLVYDVHLGAEIPWIVMEYIAGDSLKHWLDQGKRFTDQEDGAHSPCPSCRR